MAIEIHVEGVLEKEEERHAFSEVLLQLCRDEKVKLEDYDTTLEIEVCPEGKITCQYIGTVVHMHAQTNVVGPGFHAYVCSFIDHVIEQSFIDLEVIDETMYYEQRNFEDLKYRQFYPWLESMLDQIEMRANQQESSYIGWSFDTYLPADKPHHIISALGYLPLRDIQEYETEAFAQRIFIWNEPQRDAYYYRNCALSLLWTACFFTYSNMNEDTIKTANAILDYMETAFDCDDRIELPMDSYHVLCEAIHRQPVLTHTNTMSSDPIGYRKEPIFYPFHNWEVCVDGCCEKSYDASTQTLHFMAPYKEADDPWVYLIRVNAYQLQQDPKFSDIFDIEDAFCETLDDGIIKGVVQHQADYEQLIMQIVVQQDTLFFECIIRNKEDIEMIKAWILLSRHMGNVSSPVRH